MNWRWVTTTSKSPLSERDLKKQDVFKSNQRMGNGRSSQSCCTNLRKPKIPRTRERRLLPRELEKVSEASESPLLADIIRFAVETAMRREEISRMKWDHVDLKEKSPIGPANQEYGRGQANPVRKERITDWKVACLILSRFQVYVHFLHRVCGGTMSSFHSTGTNNKMDKPTNGTSKPRDG